MGEGDKKRTAESSGDAATPKKKKSKRVDEKVNPLRVRELRGGKAGDGPVIYWMQRDQRVKDNWALLYAIEKAAESGKGLAVAFNMPESFKGKVGGARQTNFMLRGLEEMQPKLKALNIPFFLLRGSPDTVAELANSSGAGLVVCDFHPFRERVAAKDAVKSAISCPMHQVDAHNIIPCWEASPKLEYAARTIRKKITDKLKEYLVEFPTPQKLETDWPGAAPAAPDWKALLAEGTEAGKEVPEVAWCRAGEAAAALALESDGGFFSPTRFKMYDGQRNNPCESQAVSNLSPYFTAGQLAPQRAALAAADSKWRKSQPKSSEGFLEELVVRRELSDNWCFYNPNYDKVEGTSAWAVETLKVHSADKREYLYTLEQLEKGKTHDELWNAAQDEGVHRGKIHGFMRMYWAKKILEWTESPEQALEFAIYLNDKWNLDGTCPNGVVGCMWSICGIHDQGWAERPVFGKIRYMNYNGCKRKFKIEQYVAYVEKNKALGPDKAMWGSRFTTVK